LPLPARFPGGCLLYCLDDFPASHALCLVEWQRCRRRRHAGGHGGKNLSAAGQLSIVGACTVSIDSSLILNAVGAPDDLARLLPWRV
jgi:hypothetical protein